MDQHSSSLEEHLHLELFFWPNKGEDKKAFFCFLVSVSGLSQCNQPAVGVQILFE